MPMRQTLTQIDIFAARKANYASIAMILLSIIFIIGLTISSLYREKTRYIQTSIIKTSAQAQLLAEGAASVLYDVDLTMLTIKHLLENESEKEINYSDLLDTFILTQIKFLPQVTGVAFYSSTGGLLHSVGTWSGSTLPSLVFHRDEWQELFVGTTQQLAGGKLIFLSRRVENRDGDFIGSIAAEIDPKFFYKSYENYLGIDVAAIVLFDIEGIVLSGWSDDRNLQNIITGLSLKDIPLFSALAQSLPSSGGLQPYEDKESVVSSVQLTGFPFHFAVASRKNIILANWHNEIRKNFAILAVSIVLAGMATFLAMSQRKRRRIAEKQLRLHQQHLELTVVERTKEISLMNDALTEKNEALQKAIAEIRTLSAYLPICSHCKKIRDDSGYWNQLEAYIGSRTGAEFSHSICPECAAIHYPGIDIYGGIDNN